MRRPNLGSVILGTVGILWLGHAGTVGAQGAKAEAEAGTDVNPPAATTKSSAATAETQVQNTGDVQMKHSTKKESATVSGPAGSASTTTKTHTAEVGTASGDAKAKTSTSQTTSTSGTGNPTASGAKAEAEVEAH